MRDEFSVKKLGEVCDVVGGGTPKTSVNNYWDGNYFWATPKDLSNLNTVEITKTTRKITSDGLRSSSARLLPPGSVILSSRAPIGYIAINSVEMATNQGCRNFICNDQINNRYLYYFLKCNTKLLNTLGSGSTFLEVSGSRLKDIEIPLPSLGTQKKIVAKIEELFSKIDEVKRLRVESQRETANLLPAALYKIFEDGKKKGWEEKELETVVEVRTKRNINDNLPYVGMEDVESNTGKFIGDNNVKKVKSTTFYFDEGCILFGKLRPYLNKVLIPDFTGHCTTEFLPIYPKKNLLIKKWLWYWITSVEIIKRISASGTGARMPRANMKEVLKYLIPIPPLPEQRNIVEYLDSLSEKTKKIQGLQAQTAEELKELQQSILYKAFNGELI